MSEEFEEKQNTDTESKEADSFESGRQAAMEEAASRVVKLSKEEPAAETVQETPEENNSFAMGRQAAADEMGQNAGTPYQSSEPVMQGSSWHGSPQSGSTGYGNTSQPYGSAGNNGQPYANAGNNSQPYGGAGNNSQPYGGAGNNSQPYGNTGNNGQPYGNTGNNGQPYGSGNNGQPYGGAGNNGQPYGSAGNTGTSGRPYGSAGNMGNNGQPYNGMPGQNIYAAPGKSNGIGFGIASLVLGILSIFCFAACVNFVMAIIAIILGIVQIVSCKQKGLAIAGIITSAISILVGIVFWVIMFGAAESGTLDDYLNDAYYEFDDDYDDDDYDDWNQFFNHHNNEGL